MNINKYTICNSPIEKKRFQNQNIYIKRDDLLHADFSGNKARKFYYYLLNDFPNIKKVVSYGSNQSNAMYSLSVLSRLKGWEFEYYTHHIPQYLIDNPVGNYKHAIKNGMRVIIGKKKPKREEIENSSTVFVEEGGRDKNSHFGIKVLSKEIIDWQERENIKEIDIFLPSGTGTTALFLQKSLLEMGNSSKVYTTPCVGDSKYLKKQFEMLESDSYKYPTIIKPRKKFHFGKLYKESYKIWLQLRQELEIEFDMLYDPIGWLTLIDNLQNFQKPILYIHQGGLKGNESMLERYKRKYGETV
jgi:1-aminocyclopropane-1-carboxylate deaminase/D-cysteine desulfhydrase-like pyridoxal-dependent ACC family enzyme